MKAKFYHFAQNNSGGYFIEDHEKGISESVIIEAKDGDTAYELLSKIGESIDNFWDYCPCCGERWSSPFSDEGTDTPMIWGKSVYDKAGSMFRNTAFVHRLDGTIEKVDLTKND